MKFGKIWGNTELIHKCESLEFHRIEAKKGGTSSKHLHKFKCNGFFVESGRIIIRVWKNNYDLVDETILGKGQWSVVEPTEYHQFEALENSVFFELYWTMPISDDIIREDHGFIRSNK